MTLSVLDVLASVGDVHGVGGGLLDALSLQVIEGVVGSRDADGIDVGGAFLDILVGLDAEVVEGALGVLRAQSDVACESCLWQLIGDDGVDAVVEVDVEGVVLADDLEVDGVALGCVCAS